MTTSTAPPPARLRLPAVAQALAMTFSIERYPRWLLRRFAGEPMIAARLYSLGEIVAVSDPVAVRELLAAPPEHVRAGEANALVLNLLGAGSLIHLDGDEHLRVRRLLLPAFHGEAIARYRDVVTRVAVEEVARWPRGQAIALHPRMKAIALEVIVRGVLGASDSPHLTRIHELLPRVLQLNPAIVVAESSYPSLTHGRLARALPWIRARRELLALLDAEIAARRAEPGEDVLSALIASRDDSGRGLTDAELRDQMLTLLLAGHETTATALAWAFVLLVERPDALTRLRAELDRGETTYLDAVVTETLRLRPPLESAWRRVVVPIDVAGRCLEAGTLVALTIRAVQRRGWPDAWDFRPERFLPGGAGAPAPYANLPFGGGTRRCIGASFAEMEMAAVLTAVLARVDLAPASRRRERQTRLRSITTVPARGARVRVSSRASRR